MAKKHNYRKSNYPRSRRRSEYENRIANSWRPYHYGALITLLTIIMAILASITPAGNSIIDLTGFVGLDAAIVWAIMAVVAAGLSAFAYNKEKTKGL